MTGTNSSSKSESLSAVETDGRLSLAAASVLTDFDAMLSFGNAMSLFEADISASEDGEDEALGADTVGLPSCVFRTLRVKPRR